MRRLFVMPPALVWLRDPYNKNGGVRCVRMAGSASSREREPLHKPQKVNVAKTNIPPQDEKPRQSSTVIALSTDCADLYATKNRRRASILSSAGDPRAHANHQQLSAQVRQAFLNPHWRIADVSLLDACPHALQDGNAFPSNISARSFVLLLPHCVHVA